MLFGTLGVCLVICPLSIPLELVTEGDLLVLIRRMIDLRGSDTVRITKVKGHADEGMVADGRVRVLDRLGNDAADEAADCGRRRVGPAVIDVRRTLSGVAVDADDIALWPSTPGLLVKGFSFSGSLHWPACGLDLGVGGFSCVELLILYELWDGERLVLEKAHPRYLRPGRPISVSAVPFGPGIDI